MQVIHDTAWEVAERPLIVFCLPEPVLQIKKNTKKIAATDLQRTLCEIFAKALGRKIIGADEIFEERVEAIEGDITKAESVDALIDYPFKTLINCAACVKHFAVGGILTKMIFISGRKSRRIIFSCLCVR